MRKLIENVVLLYAVVLFLGQTSAGKTAGYELNGIYLRQFLSDRLEQNYNCIPLSELYDAINCNIKDPASDSSNYHTLPDSLIKSSNGELLFAFEKYKENGEIDQITVRLISEVSAAMAGAIPRHFSSDRAIVAIWGDTELEEIASHTVEYIELTGLVEQKYGLLVASTGDLETAKDRFESVYRVIGGDGLVVIVTPDGPGRATVQRFIVAAGTLAEKNFESQAREFLERDRASAANDLSNWHEVAFMIRRLALNTTPESANQAVDRILGEAQGNKYHSHVWAILPTSVIKHLKIGTYRAADVFGERTEYPEIRARMVAQLEADPAEPYSEFLLYALGRFADAVAFDPSSPIHTVLSYALSHSNLRTVLSNTVEIVAKPGEREMLRDNIAYYSYKYDYFDFPPYREETPEERYEMLSEKDFFGGYAYHHIPESADDYKDDAPSLTQYLNYFNKFPERYGSRPLVDTVADFTSMTNRLLPPLEEVLKDKDSPHYDDAAYLLAWLAYHRGHVADALDRFGAVIALRSDGHPDDWEFEHLDYTSLALHQLTRIFRTMSPEEVINRVQESEVLSSYPIVWETALTSFYHAHQYKQVLAGARQALRNFGIVIEDLPVTTDPRRISDFFSRFDTVDDENLNIVYIYFSSREIDSLLDSLEQDDRLSFSKIQEEIRNLVEKYSLTSDDDLDEMWSKQSSKPRHKDLRQSIHILQTSLQRLPRTAKFSEFREWLHYKRIRLLAQFDPVEVAAANAEFSAEFPRSALLDDGIAEQVFAEAVVIGDMVKAEATFDSLRQRFPRSNSLDNAHSWMAIGWTCAGQPAKAREIDQQIIRSFLLTRHARHAQERLQSPKACAALEQLYLWDYAAMRWRERNRIDTIHASRKSSEGTEPATSEETSEVIAASQEHPPQDAIATSQASLTRIEAVEMVSELIQLHMLPGQQGLEQIRSFYADTVDYYGTASRLEDVMLDKSRYFDRWPVREYRVQYFDVYADCSDGQVCQVNGNYDWSVLSTERLALAAGTASFEYAISALPPFVVIREAGELVDRR